VAPERTVKALFPLFQLEQKKVVTLPSQSHRGSSEKFLLHREKEHEYTGFVEVE